MALGRGFGKKQAAIGLAAGTGSVLMLHISAGGGVKSCHSITIRSIGQSPIVVGSVFAELEVKW